MTLSILWLWDVFKWKRISAKYPKVSRTIPVRNLTGSTQSSIFLLSFECIWNRPLLLLPHRTLWQCWQGLLCLFLNNVIFNKTTLMSTQLHTTSCSENTTKKYSRTEQLVVHILFKFIFKAKTHLILRSKEIFLHWLSYVKHIYGLLSQNLYVYTYMYT